MIKRALHKARKHDFTTGSIPGSIWILAFPIMLANILQTAFNIVDMFWVGRLGTDAIGAVAMSGVVLFVIVTIVIGICTGTHVLIARYIGSRNKQAAENVAEQALIIGAIFSIVIAGLGVIFAQPILRVLGARGEILSLGVEYLNITFIGSLVMVYLFLVNAILRASGDAFMPMLIMVGAVILNIILDPLMIFGIGFPRMGVAGAALATVLSRGLGSLVGLYALFKGYSRIQVHFARLKVDLKIILKILKLGFPATVQMGLRSCVGLVLMAFVAKFGSYAIAAYGIGLRIFSVVLMPGFALAASAATVVGQSVGAKQVSRARSCAWQATGFNILLMGATGILFFVLAPNLIAVFNSRPDIIKLGSEYLRITSLSYAFVACGLVLGHSLMGAGDTISPMVITICCLLGIQIPLAIILPGQLNLGISGIWWAILISSVSQGVITCLWFKLGRWQFLGEQERAGA